MKDHCCYQKAVPDAAGEIKDGKRFSKFPKRFSELIKLTIPAILLAIVPKCPLCFAAYFAFFTGFGISITTAGVLRITLIVLCSGAILYLIVKFLLKTEFSILKFSIDKRRSL